MIEFKYCISNYVFFFFTTFLFSFLFLDKFASYVIFFLIIKLKKKKVFEFHLNSFFLFISSSSQPKILSIYTHSFLVYYYLYYVPYNYLLYSFILLSTLPTTLQVFFFFHQIEQILFICCLFIICYMNFINEFYRQTEILYLIALFCIFFQTSIQ